MFWPSRPLESMFIRLVRHPWKRKIHFGFPFARKNSVGKIQICGTESQLLNAITYLADIWWPLRSWQASNFFQRKIHFWNSVPCQRKSKKLKQSKKVPKSGLTEPPLYIMGARDSKCFFNSWKYDFQSTISLLVPLL